MPYFIFIDTNIYLDFYRFSGDAKLSLLKRLEVNRNIVITTTEVEMEYKKNRQNVIIESLNKLKPLDAGLSNIPSFLKESKLHKSTLELQKSLNNQYEVLKKRTAKLLEYPGLNDPVYKVLEKVFKTEGSCHLTRSSKEKNIIRKEAKQRFLLGYPPRKPNDFSMIDALNWEWIIHCAKESGNDIVIASRDSDYGRSYGGKLLLNDWLLEEFKERVDNKRSIILTNRLTHALKLADIAVTKKEERSEQKLLQESPSDLASLLINQFPNLDPNWPKDVKHRWFNDFHHLISKFAQSDDINPRDLSNSD